MSTIALTLVPAAAVILLLISGCAAPKITLTDIPHYQKTGKSYNTSAGCYIDCNANTVLLQNLLKASTVSQAKSNIPAVMLWQSCMKAYAGSGLNLDIPALLASTGKFRTLLAEALRANGYPVVEIEYLSTKRIRRRIDKMIFLEMYSDRSLYLPLKKQAAYDVSLVVAVADVPNSKNSQVQPLRYFIAWGRRVVPCADEAQKNAPVFAQTNYTAATKQAVENLFCIDAFRKALEPAAAKAVQPAQSAKSGTQKVFTELSVKK
ncbi:MAG: hypothetical protein PHH77_01255 [Victivallaceae bacterium]|nr:hypothetical protein [Victivallaceae bacterium]